jgi:hypothetical protein
MKTLLYNSATNKVISQIFDNGYLVDGKPQEVLPPIYELEYKPTIAPNITENQVKSATWIPDIVLKTYTQVWEVRDKTEAELITEKETQASVKENELDPIQIKAVLRYTTDLLTEEEQVNFYSLYPAWKPNISVVAGEKYQHLGLLYKVVQSHSTQLDWEPQNVPALFVRVAAPEEIPNWVQPTGAHDAYNTGDKVRFEGSIYESIIDANVWSPTAYPSGWKKL